MEQKYTIYQTWSVQEWDRNLRPIERLPLIGLVVRPWIDMTARDWHQTSFAVRSVTTTDAIEAGVDPTPSVTPQTPNRRTVQTVPHVIFEASEPIPTYSELPLAV
jgi:hypothetical protein